MNDRVQAIRHGMLVMPSHPPPTKPPAQGYDRDLELIVRAGEPSSAEFWSGRPGGVRPRPLAD